MSDSSETRSLKELRDELDVVDAALIEALAARQRLVAAIGRIKHAAGRPLRDFQREREVLAHVRARAHEQGISPELAADVMKLAIEASLSTQEGDRLRLDAQGDGRHAVVFGGHGKMGRWFVRFLAAQGYSVSAIDPAGSDAECPVSADPTTAIGLADVIVLATPIPATAQILASLIPLRPKALIFDIASLKSPLQASLLAAGSAGLNLCSVHPMFGPDVNMLSDRHIVLCEVSDARALEHARQLFAPTSAQLVTLSLRQHDQLIAWVLGLSHATNIVFLDALAHSGIPAELVRQISSTTFDRQLRVASAVANEDAALYHMIQHLQPHRQDVIDGLRGALSRLDAASISEQPTQFTSLFDHLRSYLRSARPGSHESA